MGVWGTNLYANDCTCDVRNTYENFMQKQFSDKEAYEKILKMYNNYINTVVGAGSIVTKDLPANVVAVGNPCKILREINKHDKEYYFKDRKIVL